MHVLVPEFNDEVSTTGQGFRFGEVCYQHSHRASSASADDRTDSFRDCLHAKSKRSTWCTKAELRHWKQLVGVGPLFMLRCDRIPVILNLIPTVEPFALTQKHSGFMGIYSNHKNARVGLKGIRDE